MVDLQGPHGGPHGPCMDLIRGVICVRCAVVACGLYTVEIRYRVE